MVLEQFRGALPYVNLIVAVPRQTLLIKKARCVSRLRSLVYSPRVDTHKEFSVFIKTKHHVKESCGRLNPTVLICRCDLDTALIRPAATRSGDFIHKDS